MRRWYLTKRAWLILGVVLLAVVLWGTAFQPRSVPVEIAVAGPGLVEEIVTNSRAGSVRARLRTQVGSLTAGRVEELPYREGAEVDSGAVLVRLDDQAARAQVALARRDLEAQAARLRTAEATAALAVTEHTRAESLAARGAIADETLQSARSRDDQARSELEAARAQVERARAALDLATTTLDQHRVLAPFSGVVNELHVELGASVIPGQALLELMSRRDLYVSAPMDELDIGRIRAGQKARVTLDPYPGRSFDAVVSRVAPYVSEIQEQNRTMEVELQLVDVAPDVVLRPGTSADVEIVLQRHDGVLRVPAIALLEGDRLFVVHDGRAEERKVETGLRNWDWVEIVSGLEPGEQVITSLGQTAIQAGTRVAPKTAVSS